MKLALGTVQFGFDYGIANKSGQVPENVASEIIQKARSASINTLDTAALYGVSEKVLGHIGVDDFDVISKIPAFPPNRGDLGDWVDEIISNSLENLSIDCLGGILLHRPLELLQNGGRQVYDKLLELKQKRIVKKIGISIYQPSDLDDLLHDYAFDIVQAPLNIFDRRLLTSRWLKRLHDAGTEVHVRSVFLQGLLVMPQNEIPDYFNPWKSLFDELHQWIQDQKLSSLEACIGYANSVHEVSRIIVGVDSPEQLDEIVSATTCKIENIPDSLQSVDPELLNPALWRI